jgi:hypothetical protein
VRSLADWLALPGRTARALAFAALLACAFGRPAVAQAPEPTLSALERWLALDVPTGDETRATDAIRAADPGWRATCSATWCAARDRGAHAASWRAGSTTSASW